MGLVCPECSMGGSLQVRSSLEIPPDARSDEIVVELLECRNCGFQGAGIYEESRRGALDDESVDHYGYFLDDQEWKRLEKIIRACPDPHDKNCACSSHRQLNSRHPNGRWAGLEGFELGDYFNVVYRG